MGEAGPQVECGEVKGRADSVRQVDGNSGMVPSGSLEVVSEKKQCPLPVLLLEESFLPPLTLMTDNSFPSCVSGDFQTIVPVLEFRSSESK